MALALVDINRVNNGQHSVLNRRPCMVACQIMSSNSAGQCSKDVSATSSDQTRPKLPNAALVDLQKPEKLSLVLKEDQVDCLPCRLTGTYADGQLTGSGGLGLKVMCRLCGVSWSWWLYIFLWHECIEKKATCN